MAWVLIETSAAGDTYLDQDTSDIVTVPVGGNPNSGVFAPTPQPKIITNQNGVSITSGQTTLDKILSTTLSLAALARGASYVPTTVQPSGYGVYGSQIGVNPLGNRAVGTEIANNNALGTLEAWVKTHPIPVAIAVAIGVAYLAPSPRSSRR